MCSTCGCKSAETKLSKTSCCCGADEANPCACMKAPEPMECSAKAPKCACYKALEKNAEFLYYYVLNEKGESPADFNTLEEAQTYVANSSEPLEIYERRSRDDEAYKMDKKMNAEYDEEDMVSCRHCWNVIGNEKEVYGDETVEYEMANGELVCVPCYKEWMEEYKNDLDPHYSPFYAESKESSNQSITTNKIGESLAWNNRIMGMGNQWRNGKYDINSISQEADIIGYTIVHEDYLEKKLDWMEDGVNLGSKDTDIAEINFAGMKIYTGGDGSFPVMGMYENINDYYARTQNKPHPRGNMTMMEFFDREDYEKAKYEEAKWEYEFIEWVRETYQVAPTYFDDGSEMPLYHHVAEKIGQENIPKLLVGARLSLHNPTIPTLKRRDSKSSIWVLEIPDLTHLKTTKYKRNYRGKREVFINTETTVAKFFSNLKAIYPKGDFIEGSRNNRYKQFTINIPSFGEYRWYCHEVMLVYDSVSQDEERRREGVKRRKSQKQYRLQEEEKMKALKEKYGAETFEATIVHQGKVPDGAIGKAMLNQSMITQASIEATINELENKVNLGLISEKDLMDSLKKKFGAEYDVYSYEEDERTKFLKEYFATLKAKDMELAKEIEYRIKNEMMNDERPSLEPKIIEAGFDPEIITEWVEYYAIELPEYDVFEMCGSCEGEGWRLTSYTPATRWDPADGDGEDCGECGGSGKIDPSNYMYFDDKGDIQYEAEAVIVSGSKDGEPIVRAHKVGQKEKDGFMPSAISPIDKPQNDISEVAKEFYENHAETKKRKTGFRKCSKCGNPDHNSKSCESPIYDEALAAKESMIRQCDRAIESFTDDAKDYSLEGNKDSAKTRRSDATDMKKIKRYIENNHFGKAFWFARELDSEPREYAPYEFWGPIWDDGGRWNE